ncbi:hypothetical protein [Stakelama tenebrarum]|uniref:Uncharacterized protein n=1 Tax=Stakelama tenebrarum TaxID=2711215 RepID=A0A6G6Y675_9SPHN|nr:hypothetical protein [Sphingosinithalassobacter tenebrarum]QIG80297.1 hypothetical protein G5C33_11265 [Sphingosinithalassobacter tenebrarum]
MRYFLDTEFNGFLGDLISIALVPEDPDAPIFYEAVACNAPNDWVRENVLPVLEKEPVSREEISDRLGVYLATDPEPVLVADWPEDLAHVLCLTVTGPGHRLKTPPLRFELLTDIQFNSAAASRVPHNARHDAIALRQHVLLRER